MLCNALNAIGRVDIAEVIRDKEMDYKKEKALSNRGKLLSNELPYCLSDVNCRKE